MNVASLIDPEVAAVLERIGLLDIGAHHIGAHNLHQARAVRNAMPRPALSDRVERTDHVLPGEPPVPVRVHRPKAASGALPCIYSIHGGGYVVGTYSLDDPLFDDWCSRLGVVGVSVEYRLAPDTTYPGPLEDCYRGLQWVYGHAGELGIDPARVGVYGASAGGGLAAALALLARDRGEFLPAFQALDCPMLDDRQLTESSQLDNLYVWSRDSNAFGWRCYPQHLVRVRRPVHSCRHAPPTCRVCRQRSSRSAPSTASATRTSTTRCASPTPVCRPSYTSIRAPRTATSTPRRPPSPARTDETSTSGSAASSAE